MVQRKCKTCGSLFSAKEADVKRGWANFCSKSCKAIRQAQRRGRSHRQENYIIGAAEDGK